MILPPILTSLGGCLLLCDVTRLVVVGVRGGHKFWLRVIPPVHRPFSLVKILASDVTGCIFVSGFSRICLETETIDGRGV